MKVLKYLLLICCLASSYVEAQNLINNPSFEDTIPDNVYPGPPQLRPYYWFLPTEGSSDFFNSVLVPSGYGGGVPENPLGFQFPRTGDAYLGFAIFVGLPSIDSREYIEGVLTTPLVANHKYCVEFFVCASNACQYNTDDIGAYFSIDSVALYANHFVLNFVPQIENVQGNILSDTLNWMSISGEFYAQGGETYMTIGNFRNDANTTLSSNPGGIYDASYYFIDDISVTDCTVGISEEISSKISIYPTLVDDFITIDLTANNPADQIFHIINSLGQLVSSHIINVNTASKTINLSNLGSGVYLIQKTTGAKRICKMFVKK